MASVTQNGQGSFKDTEQLIPMSKREHYNHGGFDKSQLPQSATARTVRVKVTFQKIGDIDTIKETFIADVLVEARWREPLFDGGNDSVDVEKINWKQHWNPRLSVLNFLGEQKDPYSYSLERYNNEAEVVERRRFNGTFSEQLELDEFPFDLQELQVTVVSAMPNNEIVLQDYDCHLSKANPQSFADEQEWSLNDSVNVRISRDPYKLPSLSVFCSVSRRFGFYVWNFMFVMFLISALSLATWAIAVTKPENRIQVTFVLLLTTITFKFAVSSSLPRISYLTYLDKYILTKMVFMVMVAVWHGLALTVHVTSTGAPPADIYFSWPDKVVFIIMSAAFVTINLAYFLMIYRARKTQKAIANNAREQTELVSLKDDGAKTYGSVTGK